MGGIREICKTKDRLSGSLVSIYRILISHLLSPSPNVKRRDLRNQRKTKLSWDRIKTHGKTTNGTSLDSMSVDMSTHTWTAFFYSGTIYLRHGNQVVEKVSRTVWRTGDFRLYSPDEEEPSHCSQSYLSSRDSYLRLLESRSKTETVSKHPLNPGMTRSQKNSCFIL